MRCRIFDLCGLSILALIACLPNPGLGVQENAGHRSDASAERSPQTKIRDVVQQAFAHTHRGWSSDEVVLNLDLNRAFIEACRLQLPDVAPVDFNWTLLNMRKAGLLQTKATRRSPRSTADVAQLAEIAARLLHDRYRVSTDRIMADPRLRAEFDQEVRRINPAADDYAARKAAFRLRKQRQLRPELIARIADWGRRILSYSVNDVQENPALVPEQPGIYIFRDATGYLYIGQSDNLQKRLKQHLDASSNFSLAKYLKNKSGKQITIELHAFAADSRARQTMVRRAYESELIASRKPRFNLQP